MVMGYSTCRPFNRTRLTGCVLYEYGHEYWVGRPIIAVFNSLARRGDAPIAGNKCASDTNDGKTLGDGPAPEEPFQ